MDGLLVMQSITSRVFRPIHICPMYQESRPAAYVNATTTMSRSNEYQDTIPHELLVIWDITASYARYHLTSRNNLITRVYNVDPFLNRWSSEFPPHPRGSLPEL